MSESGPVSVPAGRPRRALDLAQKQQRANLVPRLGPPSARPVRRTAVLGGLLVGLMLCGMLGSLSHLEKTGSASPSDSLPQPLKAVASARTLEVGLQVTSLTADPATMVIGHVSYLNVTTTGGAPPLHYDWQHLPPGCHSFDISSLGCSPMGVQHYLIEVVVNDSANGTANATVALTVTSGYGGPPTIQSFVADPASVSVFSPTSLEVQASSSSSTSTASLTYTFLGLPKGCSSFNQTRLTCVPTVAGSFHLFVTVADGFGATAVASAFLNVTDSAATPSSSGIGPAIWLLPIGIVLVASVVVVLMLPPKRRKPVRTWTREGTSSEPT